MIQQSSPLDTDLNSHVQQRIYEQEFTLGFPQVSNTQTWLLPRFPSFRLGKTLTEKMNMHVREVSKMHPRVAGYYKVYNTSRLMH